MDTFLMYRSKEIAEFTRVDSVIWMVQKPSGFRSLQDSELESYVDKMITEGWSR